MRQSADESIQNQDVKVVELSEDAIFSFQLFL